MKIQLITGFILANLFLSSTLAVGGNQTQIAYAETKLNHNSPTSLGLDQADPPSSKQLILDTLDLLVDRKNQSSNSWQFSALSTDSEVYYGIAGGMAGTGIKLLEALDYDIVKDDIEIKSQITSISTEIGLELVSVGDINSTHALWNITNSDNYVDLSWDFGLAGIAAFFSFLYNVTENDSFKTTAQKTFTSIIDLTILTGGLHWENDIYDYVNLDWYNPYDFDVFTAYDEDPKIYSGMAFGTAGIAKSALTYLSKTDDGSNTTINQILTDSLTYLDTIAIVNGSQRSYLVAEELFGLKSTNVANGVSGIAQLYANLFDYTSNSIYKDKALGIVNWLNGTVNFQFRMEFGYIINETILVNEFEFGITHGMAGVIDTLFEIGNSLSNDTARTLSEELSIYLYQQSVEVGDDLEFSENTVATSTQGSTSWAFGMSGIYPVLFKIAEDFDDDTSRERIAKMKNYLFSQVATEGTYSAFKTSSTNGIETNPSIGIPGFILMLSLPTKGKLNVAIESLNFATVEIASSKIMTILVENVGEKDIVVTWNQTESTDTFSSETSGITISGRSNYKLNISFSPTEERIYPASENIWIIEADSSIFEVSLTGLGFDIPILSLTSSVLNNSLIDAHNEIDFSLSVTDSSVINSVTILLGDTTDTIALDQASGLYKATVDTNPLSNGTYTIVFSATDANENTGQVKFTFDVGVYTSNILDKAVSNNTRNILIGVTIVLFAAAIIVTRFYMKSSS